MLDTDQIEPQADIGAAIHAAIAENDAARLSELIDPLPYSDALRELLSLPPEERDSVLELVSTVLAAELIGEAPDEMAADLDERLEPERVAEILEELDSDVQADVIGEMDVKDAEAVLSEMDAEDAADVRRLVAYDEDCAGGLMMAEVFQFSNADTVGKVLRALESEDDDFERYRGQHPYTIDEAGRPVGVVSRSAIAEAVLERSESESLKRQGVVGDELRSMPLLLKRLGQDPAAASGPLLTTITDMAGLFFVLNLATLMMPWLI